MMMLPEKPNSRVQKAQDIVGRGQHTRVDPVDPGGYSESGYERQGAFPQCEA